MLHSIHSVNQFVTQKLDIAGIGWTAIRNDIVNLGYGKRVEEKELSNFCAITQQNTELGIAVKNTFNGDIIIAEFHRPLFNRESCAGEEKNICIHVLNTLDRKVAS